MSKFLILLLSTLLTASFVFAKGHQEKPKKIHWIMAHNPTNGENNKLIQAFAKSVNKKSKGKLFVTTSFLDNSTADRHDLAREKVQSGEAEMSQISLGSLRDVASNVDIFNIPFLFKNHDEIKAATGGEVGEKIKSQVFNATRDNGQISALAYTYSGGFFVMYGSKKIESIKDFTKAKMLYKGFSPRHLFFEKMGAEFVKPNTHSREKSVAMHADKEIDLEESELARPYILARDNPKHAASLKYVYESNHGVYLTAIIINEKFMSSLSAKEKEILITEVNILAEKERTLSIKQANDAKKFLLAKGSQFIEFSPHMIKQMEEVGQGVVNEKFKHLQPLIEKIKGQKLIYAVAD